MASPRSSLALLAAVALTLATGALAAARKAGPDDIAEYKLPDSMDYRAWSHDERKAFHEHHRQLLHGKEHLTGPRILHKRVSETSVRRDLLVSGSSCGEFTIKLTNTLLSPWDQFSNLYEANFTNNCAYNIIGVNQYAGCNNFRSLIDTGLQNKASPLTSCQTGKVFFPVDVYVAGWGWRTGEFCQMGFNVGDCTKPADLIQIPAGKTVQFWYVDNQPQQLCYYKATYDRPDNLGGAYTVTKVLSTNCAKMLVWTMPPGCTPGLTC